MQGWLGEGGEREGGRRGKGPFLRSCTLSIAVLAGLKPRVADHHSMFPPPPHFIRQAALSMSAWATFWSILLRSARSSVSPLALTFPPLSPPRGNVEHTSQHTSSQHTFPLAVTPLSHCCRAGCFAVVAELLKPAAPDAIPEEDEVRLSSPALLLSKVGVG